MRLSAPLFRLKRQARLLSRRASIPLNQALDRIARGEGFRSWSALSARFTPDRPAARIYRQLQPGDLLLLAARPGHGKTMLGLEMLLEAAARGRHTMFFTLEWSLDEARSRLASLGSGVHGLPEHPGLDTSDAISADHIMHRMQDAPRGSLAVVDYLQLLDQDRRKPDVAEQLAALKAFAARTGVILVLISQIDRSFDPDSKPMPDMADIRLPNPLQLSVFTKACFVHDGEIRLDAVAA